MNDKLLKLNKLFQENRGKYVYSKIELVDFYEIEFEDYKLNLKLFKSDDIYRIFIFIESTDALLYKGLLQESTENLINEYNRYVEELKLNGFEKFIDKYYELMKSCY